MSRFANIAAITLAALALRVATTSWTGFTTDEANGVSIALTGSWSDMLVHLKEDGNPPLFYALVRVYAHVFGGSDLALKLMTVALSTLTVPLSYWICRGLLGRELSLQVAAMIALCPTVVRFTTMVRGYVLMPTLSLFSTWAMIRLLARPRAFALSVAYGASTVAMVLCHYWGAFVAIGQAAAVVILLLKRSITTAQLGAWLAGTALALVLFLPWLPILFYQTAHNLSPWALPPWPSSMIMGVMPLMLVGPEYSGLPSDQMATWFTDLLMGATLVVPAAVPAPPAEKHPDDRGDSARRRSVGLSLWKLAAVVGLLAGILVSYVKPVMRERYLIPFVPLYSVIYVCGFSRFIRFAPLSLRNLVPVILWLPLWMPQYYRMVALPETGTPAMVREIEKGADPSRDLVVISWQSIAPAITFYLPDTIATITFPDLSRSRFNKWEGMNERLRDEKRLSSLFGKLQSVLAGGGTIWLIDRAREILPLDPENERVVVDTAFMEADMRRQDQIRRWLEAHACQQGTNILAPGRDFSVFLSVWRPPGQATGTSAPVPVERHETLKLPAGWH